MTRRDLQILIAAVIREQAPPVKQAMLLFALHDRLGVPFYLHKEAAAADIRKVERIAAGLK